VLLRKEDGSAFHRRSSSSTGGLRAVALGPLGDAPGRLADGIADEVGAR
jgi:hypothetical protein